MQYPDGEDLVLIASKGGAPEHPAWYLNLHDDPRVWVRQKSEVFPAMASDLDGEEYQTMWGRVTDWNPGFQEYQDNTERRLPLVRLQRVEEHD
jgi:deazaflavin-dependent oxidoreductase (nitroreductase family)